LVSQDVKRHAANAFVLVEPPSNIVLGFYTLSATSVTLADVPPAVAAKMARYPNVSATLLGRLAVDHAGKGKGLGATLLLDAMLRAYNVSRDAVASQALVVDAMDDEAKSFYEKYSFITLNTHPMRLFITMGEIKNLLQQSGLI
jgi:GNAT superfamily N-acetyltransferase